MTTRAQWLWVTGWDTGISSITIWEVMTGEDPPGSEYRSVPLDPDDFGRCYRLLKQFPSWRKRLGEVAKRYREWAPLVERWGDMERLYERDLPTGCSKELYGLMHELTQVNRKDGAR